MNRYYGKYRAVVTNVGDPLKINRVKLRIPSVLGDLETDWAYPADLFPWVPVVNDKVWAEFEEGDKNKPIYMGRWVAAPGGTSGLPAEVVQPYPNGRVVRSPDGGEVLFNANTNEILIQHSNGTTKIQFAQNGAINIIVPDVGIPISVGDGTNLFPCIVAGSPLTPCQFTGGLHVNIAPQPKTLLTP